MRHIFVDESTYLDAVDNGLVIEAIGRRPMLLTVGVPKYIWSNEPNPTEELVINTMKEYTNKEDKK